MSSGPRSVAPAVLELNLQKENDWKITCEECPGAGNGPVVPLKKIEAKRGEVQI